MGMGTGGIPTTDNIPETTEKLGCTTDNIPETTEIYEYRNTPEFLGCLGYIISCGYPTRTHTHTRGNSVAHVCAKLNYFNLNSWQKSALYPLDFNFNLNDY